MPRMFVINDSIWYRPGSPAAVDRYVRRPTGYELATWIASVRSLLRVACQCQNGAREFVRIVPDLLAEAEHVSLEHPVTEGTQELDVRRHGTRPLGTVGLDDTPRQRSRIDHDVVDAHVRHVSADGEDVI